MSNSVGISELLKERDFWEESASFTPWKKARGASGGAACGQRAARAYACPYSALTEHYARNVKPARPSAPRPDDEPR